MKFSFAFIKKLVPAVKNKQELIEKLNLHAFEVADARGDVFDVSIAPNRFSDAASHWGIAREISAILGLKYKEVQPPKINRQSREVEPLKIEIRDKKLCLRYAAQYFENVRVSSSPKWMQKILTDCGLRPINNIVDIMNYAMLETGQPLHAFDYDKLATSDKRQATIIVRRAQKGEKITTLDDKAYNLSENILVIADQKRALAIAGIKGGKYAEVGKNTKRIIVEAANFEGVSIYKSSKFLKLGTDASLRFSHNITPNLVPLGLNRAAELLKKVVNAKAGRTYDVNSVKPIRKIIRFDSERFHRFIGVKIELPKIRSYLERLGFKLSRINTDNKRINADNISINQRVNNQHKSAFLVEVPPLRQDIETFEDLAEEVARLYGYNNVKSAPPHIHIIPSGFEDQIVLKDKIRRILLKMGLDEIYNYSFISEQEGQKFVFNGELTELENSISKEFYYLRPSLVAGLLKNIESNFRFFNSVRIFEIGKIFFKDRRKTNEKLTLGIAISSEDKESFFELKGLIKEFLKKIGLVDFLMAEPENVDWVKSFTKDYLEKGIVLKLESGSEVFGYLGQLEKSFGKRKINVCEIDLDILLKLVSEEHEYRPLPKYPSIMRDISIAVPGEARVGNIMQAIQEFDLKYIDDVDLIDEYEDGLTFRIVFQAEDRTLTNAEVNKKMEKIEKLLQSKFKAKIR